MCEGSILLRFILPSILTLLLKSVFLQQTIRYPLERLSIRNNSFNKSHYKSSTPKQQHEMSSGPDQKKVRSAMGQKLMSQLIKAMLYWQCVLLFPEHKPQKPSLEPGGRDCWLTDVCHLRHGGWKRAFWEFGGIVVHILDLDDEFRLWFYGSFGESVDGTSMKDIMALLLSV